MHKIKVRTCHVLQKNQISKNNCLRYFMEYGNLVTINICDNKIFEGIITFGSWHDNIDNSENWINKECKILYEEMDENTLYEKAENIFNQNSYIRTIPVVNKRNELVANIERYDSIEEIEQTILGSKWESLLQLTFEDELQSEFAYVRDIIKKSNYKLIGKNYLSQSLHTLLGLQSTQNNNEESLVDEEFDFIIDMEAAYQYVRKNYAGDWYKNVYSCAEFLDEVIQSILEERFTKWQYCTKGKYCNLDLLLKLWKAENIVLQKNRLMTREYNMYLSSHGYHFQILNAAKSYFYADVVINGVVHFQNNVIRAEEMSYLENQLVELNLKCKRLDKNVHVLNFDISGSFPFNSLEKKRIDEMSKKAWYLLDKSDLGDFFGSTYHVDEWVDTISSFSKKRVRGRGTVSHDGSSEDLTYYNYIRYTTDVPDSYQNTIYFFGVCIAEGLLTKDEDTIESILQREINRIKRPYRIINLGNTSTNSIDKMFKSIDLEDGDIIITFLFSATDKTKETIPVIDLIQAFSGIDEHHKSLFFDMMAHSNARANRCIAEYILNCLMPLLTVTGHKEKIHSLYTVFNNDDDIEWVRGGGQSIYLEYRCS